MLFSLLQPDNATTPAKDVGEQISRIPDILADSLQTFLQTVGSALPSIIGALTILIAGWLFAKLIAYLIRKLLTVSRFDDLADKINVGDMLAKANIKTKPSVMISRFVYWGIILFVFVMATDSLGWNIVSTQISHLIAYLPTLFSAVVLFILGFFVSSFVRDVIAAATSSLGMKGGRFISQIIFYFLLIMFTITVLNQLGIDTQIITYQLVLFIGSILLAGSISYGFASRKVLSSMLATYFSRNTYMVGQVIRFDGIEGQIVKIDRIFMTIQTDGEKLVVPTKELLDKRVSIIRDPLKSNRDQMLDDLLDKR